MIPPFLWNCRTMIIARTLGTVYSPVLWCCLGRVEVHSVIGVDGIAGDKLVTTSEKVNLLGQEPIPRPRAEETTTPSCG